MKGRKWSEVTSVSVGSEVSGRTVRQAEGLGQRKEEMDGPLGVGPHERQR